MTTTKTSWAAKDPDAKKAAVARVKAWRKRYPEKTLSNAHARYFADPQKYMWRFAKQRARQFGLEFTITPEDIKIPTHCPIFGMEIGILRGGTNSSASLDRLNNNRGYVPGNIAVVSWRANRMRGNATLEELRAVYKFYSKNRGVP